MDQGPNQANYFAAARQQRDLQAHRYLRIWNISMLVAFDNIGKMSQFGQLWRGFTCGQLNKLLNQDYPQSNLPFQIRSDNNQIPIFGAIDVEQDYHFVGVCYWPPLGEFAPKLFKNPNQNSEQTYAEVSLFIPAPRPIWSPVGGGGGGGAAPVAIGGVPGDPLTLPGGGAGGGNNGNGNGNQNAGWAVSMTGTQNTWDLLNQSWTVKLVPAVSNNIVTILQTTPPAVAQGQAPRVPSLGNVTPQDLSLINSH
jgi:hypothetical protein